MESILNHQVLRKIGESLHSDVFLARSTHEVGPVVLRRIKRQYQSEGLATFLTQQIEQLKQLHLPRTAIPVLKRNDADEIFLVQPHFKGIPLTKYCEAQASNLSERERITQGLRLGASLAELLEEIHRAGHIHKGVKPSNVLVSEDGSEMRLIDDVQILDINELSHFINNASFCNATLPFISPEQTGRIRHSLDYTTDLYSLGAVLYWMFAGKPPFSGDDPLATIHSHLAESPRPLTEIVPGIPAPLSQLVEKLLQKPPEKRYQTATGVQYDLSALLEQEQKGDASTFVLGRRDYSNRITIPSIMVGRDEEKERLLNGYKEACEGEFRAILVSGFSGIGKTRLIQELQLPIVASRGYYTSGKFDQYQRHVPYSTLIQALRTLMRTFLTEDQARLRYWRNQLQKALGEQGQLIIDIVPELSMIIGAQPAVPPLPPTESRNRFNDTIGRFLACLATAEHPLTLFIDDLQWCDGATFDVIDVMLENDHEYPYLFWIGAYRHNEVDDAHRLTYLMGKMAQKGRPVPRLHLEALSRDDVNEMTASILNTWPSRTAALSKVIFRTSDGNPLFVNESLRWLHTHRHLHLGDEGVWRWDDDQIQHTSIPSTALDLFKDKIAQLPGDKQRLLQYSSCLGASFSADDLARCVGMGVAELHGALGEAYSRNLLKVEKGTIYFFHDQVQAAAGAMIEEQDRPLIHSTIAGALIDRIDPELPLEHVDNLFSIVEHLSEGRPEDQALTARHEEARFNFHAGLKAMNAMAISNACHFFRESRALYHDLSWDDDYNILFALYKNLARAEMATGGQAESRTILNVLLSQSNSDIDRADCIYEQTAGFSSLGHFTEAIEIGNRGLDYFDRRVCEDDEEALARSAQIMGEIHEGERDVWQHILDVTPSDNRAVQIETAIYSELIPDYYLAGMVPQLYLAAIQSTQNCLAGGVDESVIYGFSMVGLYLQRKDEYELSFRYEDLGMALAHRYPDTFGATKGINGILWTNMHNRSGYEHVIGQCRKNIHRGKGCGDLYNAGLSYGPLIWNLVALGADLSTVEKAATECVAFSAKFNLSLSLGLAESALAGWADEIQADRTPLSDEQIEAKIELWKEAKHVVSVGGYHTLKGISSYYLGRHEEATHHLRAAQPYLRGLSDNILNRLWYVFTFVNSLRDPILPVLDNSGVMVEDLSHCLERVRTWSELGPVLKPYLAFMVAEKERIVGNPRRARDLYLDAVEVASATGCTMLEAHLCDGLATLQKLRPGTLHRVYSERAQELYRKCGATALLVGLGEDSPRPSAISSMPATKGVDRRLDVEYLMRASRAISQELESSAVQRVIMKSIMERIGATEGYLLLGASQGMRLSVWGRKEQGQVTVFTPDDNATPQLPLSMAIVRYVEHSQTAVNLEDALADKELKYDRAVREHQIRSVLCQPIVHQQNRVGVLYLQNRYLPKAFDPEASELVRLLSTQAAISLQNATLYQQLDQSQRKLRGTFDHIQAFSALLGPDGKLIEVNRTALSRFGLQADQVLGQVFWKTPWWEPDPEQAKKVEAAFGIALKGDVGHLESRHRLERDGKRLELIFEFSMNPVFDDSQKVAYVVAEGHDVTDAREQESHLRQAQKMEAVGQLAGGVAHDLNNLLVPVLGCSSILQAELSKEKERKLAGEIEKAALRARDIVQQLLAFSRKQVVEPKPTDLGKLIRAFMPMLRRWIREDIDIEVRIAKETGAALCDASQIEQILMNLTVNAQHAMSRGGHLELRAESAEVTPAMCIGQAVLEPGPHVRFSVKDDGVGMDAEVLSHIFEPFFTTREVGEGTGLGLATVYGIVAQSKGAIMVESSPGVGTTFIVYLPRVELIEEVVEVRSEVAPVSDRASGERILVVEDNGIVRSTIRMILERQGYDVLLAVDGADGIALLAENAGSIDLLMTDVVMPGMDGAQLYKESLALRPGLKVLFTSGYAQKVIAARGIVYEGKHFIQKPFGSRSLAEKVRAVLDASNNSADD